VTSPLHQPIHTVYGGAHLFKSTTCSKLGALAQKAFSAYAPDAATMAKVFGIDGLESLVHTRVREKLDCEPIEDYRIDFEDGFGVRSDAEEDAAADAAAREVTAAVQAKSLPRMFGIRVKSFHSELSKQRAQRTLNRFLSQATLPENFVVTLPKITAPEQVSELVRALEPYPDVRIEIMIETPGSIFILPQLLKAARGKCVAAHFGAYDYIASLGIAAAEQHLHHPPVTLPGRYCWPRSQRAACGWWTERRTCFPSRPRSIGPGSCTTTISVILSITAFIRAGTCILPRFRLAWLRCTAFSWRVCGKRRKGCEISGINPSRLHALAHRRSRAAA